MDLTVESTGIEELQHEVEELFDGRRAALVKEIATIEALLAGKKEALRYIDRITGRVQYGRKPGQKNGSQNGSQKGYRRLAGVAEQLERVKAFIEKQEADWQFSARTLQAAMKKDDPIGKDTVRRCIYTLHEQGVILLVGSFRESTMGQPSKTYRLAPKSV
jgi:hypothetical protein